MSIAEFDFKYNDQKYIIRSAYCPGNPESCNKLIGESFTAVDLNQDRIIDNISTGEIELAHAQEIYDYCLAMLEKDGKLNEINRRNKVFSLTLSGYEYEIKSFQPEFSLPFNEFIITESKSVAQNKTSILIDHGADGKLEELLKGTMLVEEAQEHYNNVIENGLKKNSLKKTNGSILCR